MLILIAVGVLAAAGWKYQDEIPFLRDARATLAPKLKLDDIPSLTRVAETRPTDGGARDTGSGAPAAANGLRRCMQNGTTLYTNEAACPPGSKEVAVKGGSVSVVPAFKPPPAPPSASGSASGIPNARDLLAPKDGTLHEKMMERNSGG
ncbi:hypothetical protein CDN99_19245 [Roseateles aquatilis]|uniref:DUF4124 domain-containing protein n=1 Tax=Roseateles aquatilis TaxID=431061 RepID=A0A246J2L4_9BURK|nr:hypothetical protein CDN99_19245 [Roseateles aquatilis]